MSFVGFGSSKCAVCNKDIFSKPIAVDSKSYHPDCFKCSTCNKKLLPGNYKKNQNQLYCEHDYKVQVLKHAESHM